MWSSQHVLYCSMANTVSCGGGSSSARHVLGVYINIALFLKRWSLRFYTEYVMSLYDEDEGSRSSETSDRIAYRVRCKYTRDHRLPENVCENLDAHTTQWYA
jgi:hypothetical protein